jgi:hypothetical protein
MKKKTGNNKIYRISPFSLKWCFLVRKVQQPPGNHYILGIRCNAGDSVIFIPIYYLPLSMHWLDDIVALDMVVVVSFPSPPPEPDTFEWICNLVVRHLRTRLLWMMPYNIGLDEARKIILTFLDSAKNQLSIHISIINYRKQTHFMAKRVKNFIKSKVPLLIWPYLSQF